MLCVCFLFSQGDDGQGGLDLSVLRAAAGRRGANAKHSKCRTRRQRVLAASVAGVAARQERREVIRRLCVEVATVAVSAVPPGVVDIVTPGGPAAGPSGVWVDNDNDGEGP
jgi:hypothetical protein